MKPVWLEESEQETTVGDEIRDVSEGQISET